MKKAVIAGILVGLCSFTGICNAELINVSSKFMKDMKAGVNSMAINPTNEKRTYEDGIVKVYMKDTIFEDCYKDYTSKVAEQFCAEHTDAIYHISSALFGGYGRYLGLAGATFEITNKTGYNLVLNLRESVVSFGSYKGMPATLGLDRGKYYPRNVVIPASQTMTLELYRADGFEGYAFGKKIWSAPADITADKNLFGNGRFELAFGENVYARSVMYFHREIDKNSITPYIVVPKKK